MNNFMTQQADSVASWLCPSEPNIWHYRPEIFAMGKPADRTRLHQLVTTTLGIAIYDTLDGQLRELIKTRHPGRRFSPDELAEQVQVHLAGVAGVDYGVWVYYPWSRRLVHLLPEAEFIELRTNRNYYKITPDEHQRLTTKKVGVIGLSVGQSAALTRAMERSFGEIRLADFDTLDLSNLSRLRSGVHNLGVPKVVIAARKIAEIDPFLPVRCYCEGITETNLDAFLLEGRRTTVPCRLGHTPSCLGTWH